jgi:hypothetical protein
MSCDTLARPGAPSPIGFRDYKLKKGEVKRKRPKENAFRLRFGADPNYWMAVERRGFGLNAKLSKTITNWKSKFVYDKRSHTIRGYKHRDWCLTNEKYTFWAQGRKAMLRRCNNRDTQKIKINARGVNMYRSPHKYGMCLTTLMAEPPREGIQLSWYACAVPGALAQTEDKDLLNIAQMQKFYPQYEGKVAMN